MKLTKRESALITVLLSLLAVVGVYVFLFTPLRQQISDQQMRVEELELQKMKMEILLEQPNLEQGYQQQLEEAEQNYDSFYATLNSYTIDKILNGLMDQHGLLVSKMKISPYEPVEEKKQEEQSQDAATEEKKESLLLKCTVELVGEGTFNGLMGFLDAMNDKSFCLSVRDMKVQYATESNLLEHETRFSCTVDIYGVAMPEGVTLT